MILLGQTFLEHTDRTSPKADKEVLGKGVVIPPQNTMKIKASGATETGGPKAPKEPTNSFKQNRETNENLPTNTRTHPKHQPQGHAALED